MAFGPTKRYCRRGVLIRGVPLYKEYAYIGTDYIFTIALQVSDKTQQLNIGRMEAIFEVYTDLLEHEAGSLHTALLWVLRRDFKEFCVSPSPLYV